MPFLFCRLWVYTTVRTTTNFGLFENLNYKNFFSKIWPSKCTSGRWQTTSATDLRIAYVMVLIQTFSYTSRYDFGDRVALGIKCTCGNESRCQAQPELRAHWWVIRCRVQHRVTLFIAWSRNLVTKIAQEAYERPIENSRCLVMIFHFEFSFTFINC